MFYIYGSKIHNSFGIKATIWLYLGLGSRLLPKERGEFIYESEGERKRGKRGLMKERERERRDRERERKRERVRAEGGRFYYFLS